MKRLRHVLSIILFSFSLLIFSQTKNTHIKDSLTKSGFKEYFPIHVKPSIGYMSSMNKYENILFDAKPTVYYSLFNNMREIMETKMYKPSYAFYLAFQPHIRMYLEDSKPVKTPSYKILFGLQGLIKTENNNFFAWAFESGHYSNGQAGCAFEEDLIDGSTECIQFHQTINDQSNLSELLNRTNGDFSTNLTKLTTSFRFNRFKSNDAPVKALELSASWIFYHNNLFGLADIGGYSDFNIDIYGRNRFGFNLEFMHNFLNKFRYTTSIKSELIQGAHPFVEPWRIELNITFYPLNKDLGFFATYISGHDNYNYRFVDSGNQINFGVTWDWFSPFEIKRSQIIQKNTQKQEN